MKSYKKPNKFNYNLLVIGAGSGGLVSSYIAATLKARVGLIERHKMGGDCFNTGCVPSKALIRSAKMMAYSKRAKEFGFKSTTIDYDFADVMERVQNVIKKVEPHDSIERYTSLGVECITGEAKILSPYEVQVNGKVLTTRTIIVATGAGPFVPPIPGLDKIKYLTSDNVWDIRKQPKRLLVLGGGPIGSELAQSFQRLGSRVILVERSPRIMAREDIEVSELVMKKFETEGMQILTNHTAKGFNSEGDKKILIAEHNGQEKSIEFDEVLVALGRRANVKGFGLEDLGVELTERGTIKSDEFLATNYKNIFVCGDVAGPYQFTHTAAHQAYYACVNALFSPFKNIIPAPFNKNLKVDYSVIPWATYTDPEVATVGLTETTAKEQGVAYEVSSYGIDDLDRAIADSEDHGFVKVLTKPGTDQILGATIAGYHASDLIGEFIAAMKNNFGLNSILSTIHIYPTMAEANKYLAGEWKKARKPERALRWLENFLTGEEELNMIFIFKVLITTLLFSSNSFALSPSPKGEPLPTFDHSHSSLTQVLKEYVIVKGPASQVNYKKLKKHPSTFNSYLRKLERVSQKEFNSWTKKQQYAFWVNAYNSYTLKLIIDNYPIKSIRKLGGFFKSPWEKKFFTLLGKKRHLDEIEHKILRVQFNEPRTHFAVNCASIGCPALLNEAFTAKKLEDQLEKQTKAFLQDTSRNFISSTGKLLISKIFTWFEEDFTKNGQTVQKFIAKYMTNDPSIKAKLNQEGFKVDHTKYNWDLNNVP